MEGISLKPHASGPRSKVRSGSNAARVFGYDIFISFALGPPPRGSRSYAADLARRLREADFTVFFSEEEAPAGGVLDTTLQRALVRSRTLVVILNRATLLDPRWVRTEVEIFRRAHPGRLIVPISIDGAKDDPDASAAAKDWMQFSKPIWVDEQQSAWRDGVVSDEVLLRVVTAPHWVRATTRWRILIGATLLVFASIAAIAWNRQTVAVEQRDRAEKALAAIQRELLRAQSAELRAMLFRVDGMLQSAAATSEGAQRLQQERDSLLKRLDVTTQQHQKLLGAVIGFHGDFGFLQRWEGNSGIVRIIGNDAAIDPATDLGTAKPEVIKKRYEFILTPHELDAVLALVGQHGDAMRKIWRLHPTVCRIKITPFDVARLVPEVAEEYWLWLIQQYPALQNESVTPNVQTAVLSLAFNIGLKKDIFDAVVGAINNNDLPRAADIVEKSLDDRKIISVFPALKKRRIAEANLIREAAGLPLTTPIQLPPLNIVNLPRSANVNAGHPDCQERSEVNVTEVKPVPAPTTEEPRGTQSAGKDRPKDIYSRVIKVVAEQLGVPQDHIHSSSRFVADLGADSLDTVELTMALEDEFNIEIPDKDCDSLRAVGQTVDYLRKRIR